MAETNPLAAPRVRRKSGSGFYQEGDRVIAQDWAKGGVKRVATFGRTHREATGQTYITMRYGEEPFIEAFICQRSDIVEDLPEDSIEAIEAWLEADA